MSAAKYDLTIDQGSDFKITLNIKEDGVNKDLTGWSARGQLRETLESDVAADFNFGRSPYDTTGNIVVELSAFEQGDLSAGVYFYDIEIFYQGANYIGYYNTSNEFIEYTAAELADIVRFVSAIILGTDTIPDDRFFLLDINGDGDLTSAEVFGWIYQSTTRDQAFQDAYDQAYAANENAYGTTIVNILKSGDVLLDSLIAGSVTRILQGKVNVTRQVTR